MTRYNSIEVGDTVRVQETYRHCAGLEGIVEKIELQTHAMFDDICVRLTSGELLKTARHLVHLYKRT